MKKMLFPPLAALFIFCGTVSAQLTGIRNIPGNYPTLAAAITDLNTQGVGAGGVIINMNANETAPAGGYVLTVSGTAANPVTIIGNNNTITASPSQTVGTINDAIFKITGGDFISILGFTMQENAANTVNAPTGSNTMTEWGIAFLYGSTTNGAQNNTVAGNIISLNRSYTNTWGVYSNTRHSATAVTSTADITSPAGANSNNKIYGNTISNVNMGIAFIGSSAAANQDSGNDIGGTSVATGNNITDWGGAAAASGYVSNSGTSYCIFMNHQTSLNISYNTITSAAVIPTVTFRGIVQDYTATTPSGTFTNTISNNVISMNSAQVSGTFRAIDATTGTTTVTLNINTNTIQNCAVTGVASSTVLGGIYSAGALNILNITGNIFQGNTSSAITGGFQAIQNSSAVATSATISNNQIGTATGDAINFSAVTSGAVQVIANSGGAAGSTVSILNNDIRRIVHSVTGSSVHTYISNTATNPNTNINGNTFTNLVVNTTGSLSFITNNITHVPNTVHNVNNNSVVTGFSKTGAGGTVLFYNSFSTSLTAVTETNTGNNFSNMTFTGATTITGWRCGDGSTASPFGPNKIVTNNTFSNITGGSSTIQILEVDYSNSNSSTNVISGNTISNITGGSTVTGIVSAQGNQNFTGNVISGIHTTGGATVTGMNFTGGATQNASLNKVYDLQSDQAASLVYGIRVSAGTTTTIFNNLVGDLRTPAGDGISPVVGISIIAGTTTNIYHNTVYLNCTSGGANFGSSCISTSTTNTLDLRNNAFVNLSTANGTGLTAAYRRATTTLNSYATTSGNNSFYAGTPGPNNVIFSDGTNNDQTIVDYKIRVAPCDAASVTNNPPFASTTGSSPVFLHVPAATTSPLESGGMTIAGFTTDFDNDVRPGPVGSVNGGALAPDIGADEFDGILTCAGTPTAGSASTLPATVCGSGTFTLSLTGNSSNDGIAYQWQESAVSGGPYADIPGATTVPYTTATISSTMYYVAVVTCIYSGTSSTTSEIAAIVNPLPAVTANATAIEICDGSSVTFNGSGAASYAWSGGVTDNVAFTPVATDAYTVTGTDANGCQDTASVSVVVDPLPNVTATAGSASVCNGSSITLTGNGAAIYDWVPGPVSGTVVTVSPTTTTTYTVTGTNAAGCVGTGTITITVNTVPVVMVTGNSGFCTNGSTTLTGTSGGTHQWYQNGVLIPGATNTTYVVTVPGVYNMMKINMSGCYDSAAVGITVIENPLPTVVANATATAVCDGSPVTLSGSGATTYIWTGSVTDNVAFTPLVSDTYTVTGTDGNGCTNTDMITVTVNPNPTVTVSFPMDTVCFNGGNVNLTGESPAGGAWSGTGVSGSSFDPQVAGLGWEAITYMYTDANGCSGMLTDSLNVDVCNGIAALVSVSNVTVYPNPNMGQFTIQLTNVPQNVVQVELTNSLGQLIDSFMMTTTSKQIDISTLEGGVYMLRVIDGNNISVHRVVKQ